MSSRTLLSRPRTRVYDANYNIGERYYKPMLDHCDRKYSGRASDPPPPFPAAPRPKEDDFTRPQRLMQSLDLAEDDLDMPRRRPLADSDAAFERAASVGRALANGRTSNGCFDAATDDLMDEVTSSVRRLRASKARAVEDMEDDFESSVTRRKHLALMRHERGETLADKHLEAVGIRKIRDPEEDPFFRKRVLRITNVAEADSPDLTKWSKVSPVVDMALDDSAAVARARKTRDRLADLESEIEDVAERTARRDRRAAELRSFMAENATSSHENAASVRVSMKSEKKTVTF